MTIRKGSTVEWDWGNGTAEGKVTERHEDRIERKINGSYITRN
ncbi:MAG: HVA1 family protein, partial [Pseudomonadota bacterium]|nr:HVA1 family protein [Pseudomonadota bacterium]